LLEGGTVTLFTIGHSTRPTEEFIGLLEAHAVTRLIDVRSLPRSRRNPQFDRDALAAALARHEIEYRHAPALGGLRRPRPGSVNAALHHPAMRAFADHMLSAEFKHELDGVLASAEDERVALMCAEALPEHCHRTLIADAMVVRGVEVEHILDRERTRVHRISPAARPRGLEVWYPAEQLDLEA